MLNSSYIYLYDGYDIVSYIQYSLDCNKKGRVIRSNSSNDME
jgi:hypothetical protein